MYKKKSASQSEFSLASGYTPKLASSSYNFPSSRPPESIFSSSKSSSKDVYTTTAGALHSVTASAIHDASLALNNYSHFNSYSTQYIVDSALKAEHLTHQLPSALMGFHHESATPIGYSLMDRSKESALSKTLKTKSLVTPSVLTEKGVCHFIHGAALLTGASTLLTISNLSKADNIEEELRKETAATIGGFAASQLARPALRELQMKVVFSNAYQYIPSMAKAGVSSNPYFTIPTTLAFGAAGVYAGKELDESMEGTEFGPSLLQMSKVYHQDYKAFKRVVPMMFENFALGTRDIAFHTQMPPAVSFDAMLVRHNMIAESLYEQSSILGKAKVQQSHLLGLDFRGAEGYQTNMVTRKVPSAIPAIAEGRYTEATVKVLQEMDKGYLSPGSLKKLNYLFKGTLVSGVGLSVYSVAKAEGLEGKVVEAAKQTGEISGGIAGTAAATAALPFLAGCAGVPVCAGGVLLISGAAGMFLGRKTVELGEAASKLLLDKVSPSIPDATPVQQMTTPIKKANAAAEIVSLRRNSESYRRKY